MAGISRHTPLLRPLAYLYGLGVRLRHWLFDAGVLSTKSYPIPIICVGNLSVGGTGKTPHVEEVLRLLTPHRRVALLSRGYKRQSRGLVVATSASTAAQIGDEPQQIRLKYPSVQVVVDANRRRALDYLCALPEDVRPQVVVMDDGFQHRYVRPSYSILLVDSTKDLLKEPYLPEGDLRDSPSARYRASCVVLTKCADSLTAIEMNMLGRRLELYHHQKLYYSRVRYSALRPITDLVQGQEGAQATPTYIQTETALAELQPMHQQASVASASPSAVVQSPAVATDGAQAEGRGVGIPEGAPIVLLTAIAKPEALLERVQAGYHVAEHLAYPDHHYYAPADIERLSTGLQSAEAELGRKAYVITTEKDAVRLLDRMAQMPQGLLERIYYQPIQIELLSEADRWREGLYKAAGIGLKDQRKRR